MAIQSWGSDDEYNQIQDIRRQIERFSTGTTTIQTLKLNNYRDRVVNGEHTEDILLQSPRSISTDASTKPRRVHNDIYGIYNRRDGDETHQLQRTGAGASLLQEEAENPPRNTRGVLWGMTVAGLVFANLLTSMDSTIVADV